MKNKTIKTVLAIIVGVGLFCVAYFSEVIYLADGLFAAVKYRINDARLNNLIRKETKLDIKNTNDFYGLWKDTNSSFSERFEALIDEDSLTLYRYKNNKPEVYWVGTFNVQLFTNESKTIESENFLFVSGMIENAAKSATKPFTYENGKIKFVSQYNDEYKDITLERYEAKVDRLRVIKYPGERKSFYDDKTNKTLIIGGYQISYPNYFDHTEEETEENIIDKFMVPEDYEISYMMIRNNHLVYTPSSADAHAEFFVGEYVNANISDIDEYDKNIRENSFVYMDPKNVEIAKLKLVGEKSDRITCIISNRYDDPDSGRTIYSMVFETYMLMKETNTSLIVSVSYSYDDVSDYDYLADYAKMLKGIKKVS